MAPRPGKDRLKSLGLLERSEAEMDDPSRTGTGRDRRLVLAAIVGFSLVIGGIAYIYFDDLTELAQSFSYGKLGRAQGRLHY
jgi:hypothetical protein